jgi:DNA-directed RNA polymerase subunit RPC12/RpoP
MSGEKILCPVCGGEVTFHTKDSVTRCSYCASPILGRNQSRDCVYDKGKLAKAVCYVCGDLVCEDHMEKRVGNYGGKLFTIINCTKKSCVDESSWAKRVNPEYQRLTNMDWSDKVDNSILRVTGLGAIMMMLFELFFIISMIYIQFLTPWGQAEPSNIEFWFIRGDSVIVLNIVGNFLSAMLLNAALQVYVHDRQLGSGVFLFFLLIPEVLLLLYRGLVFGLLGFPNPWYLAFLLGAFLFATLLVFVGSIIAIRTGWKKRKQLEEAAYMLGLKR